MSALFQPAKVGSLDLQHRIVLAPMTRMRTVGGIYAYPSPLMKEYYVQRASVPGTLLISEGTHISARAAGYPGVPGIFTEEQIAAWKEVKLSPKSFHIITLLIEVNLCRLWMLFTRKDPLSFCRSPL